MEIVFMVNTICGVAQFFEVTYTHAQTDWETQVIGYIDDSHKYEIWFLARK